MELIDAKAAEVLRDAERCGQFLAVLAHELRNPLQPIRNAVQILSRSSDASMGRHGRLLPMMERQLAHMARLLDDLLDVSRIANGQIELRKEEVDVAQAIQVGVEASKPLIDSMDHQMTMSLPPHPMMLDADPVRLAQIVSILLNNAAHYSAPGSHIHLAIGCAGPELRLSVKDSGIGIGPEDLDRIFEPFVQLAVPAAHHHGGLGIGLSLLRTIVALHGGEVEAHSAGPGRGSEFIVRLPWPGGSTASRFYVPELPTPDARRDGGNISQYASLRGGSSSLEALHGYQWGERR
ncbi:sensor histidine kinase [Caenimonas soli]|uniref:sensor histidine kinase n=1 Tax=Caenimonas soli TaxID=2735555 RepID=UPI001555BD33|nr:HAMP domain-containing sensor histidine kinase [Caenimonas soli]NPC57809.1 HAMP domain-containing histidine kinase [Caenimonas soli]